MQFSLQQNAVTRDEVRFTGEVAIFDSINAKGIVKLSCSIGDMIRVRVTTGTARVGSALQSHSFGGFRIGLNNGETLLFNLFKRVIF
jgi:predicted lipoprotein